MTTTQQHGCQPCTTEKTCDKTCERPVFSINTDIYETKNEWVILADMPGVSEKSLDLTLEKNVLTIKGTVDAPKEEGYQLIYSEFNYGDYEKKFSLPQEINAEKLEASMKNGVLTVRIPKLEKQVKKIAVKVTS